MEIVLKKEDEVSSVELIEEDDWVETAQKREDAVVCTADLIEGDGMTVQKNEEVASVVSTADTTEGGVMIQGSVEGDGAGFGEEGLTKTPESGFSGEEGDLAHAAPTGILTTLMNGVCSAEEEGITDLSYLD